MSKKYEDIKISILITTYNIAEYVDRCIESVLAQRCGFKYEIIVGDDGSTDGTKEKLENYCRAYPDVISLHVMERDNETKWLGPSRASRNRLSLLKYVNGKYFQYLDGDDYFCDELKLQKQFDIMEKHPKCAACGHQMLQLDEKTGEQHVFPNDDEVYIKSLEDYWLRDYIHTDTLLFRSSDIPSIKLDVVDELFNDNIITFSLLRNGPIYYLPQVMAVYRWTGTGIYSQASQAINNLREIIAFECERKIEPKLSRVSFLRHYGQFIYFKDYHKQHAGSIETEVLFRWQQFIEKHAYPISAMCCRIIYGSKPSIQYYFMMLCGRAYFYWFYGRRYIKKMLKKKL